MRSCDSGNHMRSCYSGITVQSCNQSPMLLHRFRINSTALSAVPVCSVDISTKLTLQQFKAMLFTMINSSSIHCSKLITGSDPSLIKYNCSGNETIDLKRRVIVKVGIHGATSCRLVACNSNEYGS